MNETKKEIINIEKLKKIIDLLLPTKLAKGVTKTKNRTVKNKYKKPKLKKYRFSGLLNLGNQ